jgi:hypothetical protein
MNLLTFSWYDPQLGLLWTETEVCEALNWPRSKVRKVIGEPDALGRNPHGGAYVRLYDPKRVRRGKFSVVGGVEQ